MAQSWIERDRQALQAKNQRAVDAAASGKKPGVNSSSAEKRAYHAYTVDQKRKKEAKIQAGYDENVNQARQEGQQYAGQIRGAVSGLNLANVGLDEESLAKRAAERANMFQQQQGTLVNRQGAAQRDMSEALQRRLQSSGLRGTGAAERLARVQESGLAEQAGLQQSELGVAQQQQELASKESERSAVIGAQNFIDQMKFSAENTATQLEQAGVESAKARNFSADEARKARDFQKNVLLPMQNAQFDKQMKEQIRQFNDQMKLNIKNYNLEKDAQEFNKWLAKKEADKPGIFGGGISGLWRGFNGMSSGGKGQFIMSGGYSALGGSDYGLFDSATGGLLG